MPKSTLPVPPPATTSVPEFPVAEPRLPPVRRTPPDLKWLLNERAALAGAQLRSHERVETFSRRLARAEATVRRLTKLLSTHTQELEDGQKLLASFDATIALAHPAANPEAAGTVKAWAGRYGERGSLKKYLVERLKAAADAVPGWAEMPVQGETWLAQEAGAVGPAVAHSEALAEARERCETSAGLSMSALLDDVIQDFQLYIATPAERISLRMSVRTNLRNLRKDGLAECEMGTDRHGKPLTFWRWKREPSLAELRAFAAGVEAVGSSTLGAENARAAS